MIYFILHIIHIFITAAAAASNSKVVTIDNSVNVIVKDLIENWESPFVYLKSRGYLSKDLQSAPDLEGFQQQLQESSGQDSSLNKDSKQELNKKENNYDSRAVRSLDSEDHELREMFQNFFSSNNETLSEELKSKLNVNWNMNALKYTARQSASKYIKDQEDIASSKSATPDPFSLNVQEPLIMEPLVKKAMIKDLLNKNPLGKEPLFMEPLDREPLVKEPLAKKHFYKEPLFEEHLLNEHLAKDDANFDKNNFLSGLAKILSSPEMQGKPKATNQGNLGKSYSRW